MCPAKSELERLTAKAAEHKRGLIQVVQDIQDRYHGLPSEALEHVAGALGVPLAEVCGVATVILAMDRRLKKDPAG